MLAPSLVPAAGPPSLRNLLLGCRRCGRGNQSGVLHIQSTDQCLSALPQGVRQGLYRNESSIACPHLAFRHPDYVQNTVHSVVLLPTRTAHVLSCNIFKSLGVLSVSCFVYPGFCLCPGFPRTTGLCFIQK